MTQMTSNPVPARQSWLERDGLLNFIAQPLEHARYEDPGETAEREMSEADRQSVLEARRRDHARVYWLGYPRLDQFAAQLEMHVSINAQSRGAGRMLAADGPAGGGKTHLVLFGARQLARRLLATSNPPQTPVIYVNVPSEPTPRQISAEVAGFLGSEVRGLRNESEITNHLVAVLPQHGTRVIIFDEADRLERHRSRGRPSDHLKHLADKLDQVTLVFVGKDLRTNPLFAGVDALQLYRRTTFFSVAPIDYVKERDLWTSLISLLEENLRLRQHPSGSLSTQSQRLHVESGGLFGLVAASIRFAAAEAIISRKERVDIDDVLRYMPAPGPPRS